LPVTLLTRPEPDDKLRAFYDRVRPAALGWKRFASAAELAQPTLAYNFFHWVLAFVMVYAMLFGFGKLMFGHVGAGLGLLVLGALCLAILFRSLERRGWSVFR
jgi:SSS family solute:Na+ symporter